MIDAATLHPPRWTATKRGVRASKRIGTLTTLTEIEAEPQRVEIGASRASEATYPIADTEASPWLLEVLDELNELINLPDGWDSYDGVGTSIEVAVRALDFINVLLTACAAMSQPQLTPLPEGGLQLEWHRPGLDLEIEFGFEEEPYFYFRDEASNKEWTRSLQGISSNIGSYLSHFQQQ